MLKLSLPDILKFKRGELMLTQEDMAKKIGISTRSYIDLENGKRRPYPHTLQKITNTLLIDPKCIKEIMR